MVFLIEALVQHLGPGGGGEGGGDRLGWGHIKRLYKAPQDYTKPRQTIQSPDRQYKDIKY